MKVKQNLSNEKKKNVLRGPKTPKKLKTAMVPKQKQIIKAATCEPELKKGAKVFNTSLVTHPPSPKQSLSNQGTTDNVLDIPPQLVEQSVKIILDLHKNHKKNIKVLPVNNRDYVYLQIVWMKKPDVPEKRRKYIKLHHGLFGDDPEVCLFVRDWIIHDHAKRTPDEKIEASVDYYEQYLKTHEIEGISTIMPLFQFKTEYSSYELQRKLVDRFDLFLVQASLMEKGAFLNKLGIAFNKKNKLPLTLKFPKDAKTTNKKFKTTVAALLKTSWYQMKPHSDTASIRIGSLEHTAEQIKENLVYVLNQLNENAVPGGSENIRSIMLKTSRSTAIPLYMNLASPKNVATPVLKSLRHVHNAVDGELSTLPGKKVTVLPSGDVFVVDDSDEEFDSDSDEVRDKNVEDLEEADENVSSEEDETPKVKKVVKKGKKVIKKKAKQEENFSDDSDDDVDNAEQQYLTSLKKESDDEETDEKSSDDEEKTKKGKIVKKNKKKPQPKTTAKEVQAGKRKRNNQEENQGTKKVKKVIEKKQIGNALKKPKQKKTAPSKNTAPSNKPKIVKGKKAGKK